MDRLRFLLFSLLFCFAPSVVRAQETYCTAYPREAKSFPAKAAPYVDKGETAVACSQPTNAEARYEILAPPAPSQSGRLCLAPIRLLLPEVKGFDIWGRVETQDGGTAYFFPIDSKCPTVTAFNFFRTRAADEQTVNAIVAFFEELSVAGEDFDWIARTIPPDPRVHVPSGPPDIVKSAERLRRATQKIDVRSLFRIEPAKRSEARIVTFSSPGWTRSFAVDFVDGPPKALFLGGISD